MLISKEMYLFLKDYLKWIKYGAVNYKPYYHSTGLCTAIDRCKVQNIDLDELGSELTSLFKSEGLDNIFPFGKNNYITRFHDETQHLDPIRLKWINSHIEEYENVLANA